MSVSWNILAVSVRTINVTGGSSGGEEKDSARLCTSVTRKYRQSGINRTIICWRDDVLVEWLMHPIEIGDTTRQDALRSFVFPPSNGRWTHVRQVPDAFPTSAGRISGRRWKSFFI